MNLTARLTGTRLSQNAKKQASGRRADWEAIGVSPASIDRTGRIREFARASDHLGRIVGGDDTVLRRQTARPPTTAGRDFQDRAALDRRDELLEASKRMRPGGVGLWIVRIPTKTPIPVFELRGPRAVVGARLILNAGDLMRARRAAPRARRSARSRGRESRHPQNARRPCSPGDA